MSIDTLTYLALVLLYLLAAFFCCAETAFTAVNRPRLRELAEQGRPSAKIALRLVENASSFLATVLLGTNLVHVTITTLVRALLAALIVNAAFFRRMASMAQVENDLESLATSLIVTPTLLIFSEIIPKAIARNNSEALTLALARPTDFFRILLKPFVYLIDACSKPISSLLGIRKEQGSVGYVSRDDLKVLAGVAADEGVIHQEASKLMTALLELDMKPVEGLMIPLEDVQMLPITADIADVEELAAETGFTRFPVYEGTPSHIIGVVSLRRCLAELSENAAPRSVSSLTERRVLFVPKTKRIGALLADFRESRQPMAVVTDEAGREAVGVVTDEMLLEVLTDGIRQLRDPGRPMARKLSDGRYVCDATLSLSEVEKLLGVKIPGQGAETLGALCQQLYGRNLRRNEVRRLPGAVIMILDVRKHKVNTVVISRSKEEKWN